jgi:hypothetical protein
LALVPSWQCGQSFYASCHDASYFDALCPYRAFAEPAEPAAYVEPATNAPPPAPNPPLHTTTDANAPPLSPAVPRDSVHAPHSASSASPSQRGRQTVALANERAARLGAAYPEVTRFLTAYWPTRETDDATALHTILRTARRRGVVVEAPPPCVAPLVRGRRGQGGVRACVGPPPFSDGAPLGDHDVARGDGPGAVGYRGLPRWVVLSVKSDGRYSAPKESLS